MRKGVIAVITIAVLVLGYVVGVFTTKQATYNAIENFVLELEQQGNVEVTAYWQDQSARSATLLLSVSADTELEEFGVYTYSETIQLRYGFLNTKWSGTGDFQWGNLTTSEEIFAGEQVTSEGVVSRGGLRVTYSIPELNYEIADDLVAVVAPMQSTFLMAGQDVRATVVAPEISLQGNEGGYITLSGMSMSSDTRNLNGEFFSNVSYFLIDTIAANSPDLETPIMVENLRSSFEVLRKDDELQGKGMFSIAKVDGEPAVRGSGNMEWSMEGVSYSAYKDLERILQDSQVTDPEIHMQEILQAVVHTGAVTLRLDTFDVDTESWGSLRSNGVMTFDVSDLTDADLKQFVENGDFLAHANGELNLTEVPPMLQLLMMAISSDPLPWKLELQNGAFYINGELLDLSQM